MKKYIVLILPLLYFLSCTTSIEEKKNLTITWDDFEVIKINSEKHYFDEIINPASIGFSDNFLIIGEAWRVPEEFPRMHLVDTNDMSYQMSKGKYGKGPLEITDASGILSLDDLSEFWVYNMNGRKLVKFSKVDSSLLGTDEWRLSEDMSMIRFIEKTKNGGFLASPWDGLAVIQEFDQEGKLLGSFGTWESFPERPDLGNKEIGELSTGWFKGNPEIGLFALATLYRDILKIFDYQKKEFITIEGPYKDLPLFDLHQTNGPSVFFRPESTYRYRDIAITSKYIFALYGGYSQAEINKTGKIAEDILVFDHKGNPLWNLKLDRSIIEMVFNEETGQFYGLTTDEDPGIAVFDIPKELLKK
ncbi:BF3164 family lipoprotein [Algoriphagus sp. AK58]|uniref:BF3164 family lipoprotein n=1 Tax=Algoriphagus sp. AK58 TaxID=1406877 RepID=UPI00164FD9F5|nr:BF3164 family lipoprotein [Algoriphagus sp. AK58]MBC6368203.1 hypothetical protein [Algoriphagus sp. AK58]